MYREKEYEKYLADETEAEYYETCGILRRPVDAVKTRLANGETENDEDKAFCEFYPLIRKLANRFRSGSKDLADELEGFGVEAFIIFYREKGGAELYAKDPCGKFAESLRRYLRDVLCKAKRKLLGVSASAEIVTEEPTSEEKEKIRRGESSPYKAEKVFQINYYGSLEDPDDEEDETERRPGDYSPAAAQDRNTEREIEMRETLRGIETLLTSREKAILTLLLKGRSRTEIAEMLGITVQAVGKTARRIRAKAEKYVKESYKR